MKNTMCRGDAIIALIAGKKVERLTPDGLVKWPMRWSGEGPQVLVHERYGDVYEIENVADDHGFVYREVYEPRVFLDVWEECEFKDAEKGNDTGTARLMAFTFVPDGVGEFFLNSGIESHMLPLNPRRYFWVRRIPSK